MQYLTGLNEAQREAVLATTGPVSVLAGAGSGKTRVLTTRIYHLIREGVPANKILAVTFTNKAAREMKERLRVLLGDSPLPFVATFHGLGRELLQRYGSRIGIPRHFTIFDRDDSERTIKEALKALEVDPKEVPPRAILARISKAKTAGMTAATFRERHARESFRSRIVAEVWGRYERALKEGKSLDFDDLICLPVSLFKAHADIREEAGTLFSHIHIDEFQDTNTLQGELAQYLSAAHNNVFVVGDIDQCIYTWRGATIDNLLEFDTTYPDAKSIVLATNYRSTKNIVDAANAVIEKNRNRKEKRSTTENPEGPRIRLHLNATAESEAAWIAQEAQSQIQQGITPEDIAILYRTNFQSRALEEALLRRGVPYKLLGTKFLDRKEVKDVLAWVRLALEPTRAADLVRAAQCPPRGIGKVTLAKLSAGQRDVLRPGERAKVETFEHIVQELHAESEHAIPSVFVRSVIEKSGMEAALEKGGEEDQERLENARELATLATRYDHLAGVEGISSFLADTALAGDQDELDREPAKTGVTLMTVHAAKGLEFDTVFITGLEEGLFPHQGHDDEKRDEEEERRLFYVALTRAKRQLFLTLAQVRRIYGTDYFAEPSSFIADIDEALLEVTGGEGEYAERTIYLS